MGVGVYVVLVLTYDRIASYQPNAASTHQYATGHPPGQLLRDLHRRAEREERQVGALVLTLSPSSQLVGTLVYVHVFLCGGIPFPNHPPARPAHAHAPNIRIAPPTCNSPTQTSPFINTNNDNDTAS